MGILNSRLVRSFYHLNLLSNETMGSREGKSYEE